MKKLSIVLAGVALLCCGCGAREEPRSTEELYAAAAELELWCTAYEEMKGVVRRKR